MINKETGLSMVNDPGSALPTRLSRGRRRFGWQIPHSDRLFLAWDAWVDNSAEGICMQLHHVVEGTGQ